MALRIADPRALNSSVSILRNGEHILGTYRFIKDANARALPLFVSAPKEIQLPFFHENVDLRLKVLFSLIVP